MVLLPRLPFLAANRLLDDFLAGQGGRDWRFNPTELPDAVRYASTGGALASPGQLSSLHDGIRQKAEAFGFPTDKGRSDSAQFDSALSASLADSGLLHDGEALRDEFWAFVAIVMAPDIVRWRFGTTRSRYLGGVRNTFQRLWVRGWALDRGTDSDNRWQLLDALSEDALVQIFERPSLGGHRVFARAIAEAWLRASNRHGKQRMERIMRRATVRIRIQNEIRHLSALPSDVLARILDRSFDNAPCGSADVSSAAVHDKTRPHGFTFRRTIPYVEDILEARGVVLPDRREFLALDMQGQQLAVWATLIGEGPVPTQEKATVSLCASRLRSQGWVSYVRLRTDGDLYRAISAQLTSATRAGSNGLFHIPRNSFVRAFKRVPDMEANDWEDCTVRALAEHEQEAAARDDIVRGAFQAARHRYGIGAERLRKPIRNSIERAIASCTQKGWLKRHQNTLTLRVKYAEPAC